MGLCCVIFGFIWFYMGLYRGFILGLYRGIGGI